MHVREMISAHPQVRGNTNDALIRCIEACYDCAQTCTVCADACLAEDTVKNLIQCIRLNLDCADVCAATGQIASRRTGTNELTIKQMIETCAPAAFSVRASCQTRRSNGTGRFSTTIKIFSPLSRAGSTFSMPLSLASPAMRQAIRLRSR